MKVQNTMLLTVLFALHIIPWCSQTFPVILGLISTSNTMLLDNVVLTATVIIEVCMFKLVCYCFSLRKYLDFRNTLQCMHTCDAEWRVLCVGMGDEIIKSFGGESLL